MKKLKTLLSKLRLENARIGRQILTLYALVLLIPLSVLGVILIARGSRMLSNHSLELLEADNLRVKTLMTEVADRAYSMSEDICYDASLKQLLTGQYTSYTEFIAAANTYGRLDSMIYSSQEIDRIYIYTDNPTVKDYKQFRQITDRILAADWYDSVWKSTGAFWVSIAEESYGSNLSNLCLVRRIVLPESNFQAVAVLRVSDSYIRSRVSSGGVEDAISIDGGIVYSSRRGWYGQSLPVQIDRADDYFRYCGKAKVDETECYACVSTLHPNKTNSRLYICTLDSTSPATVRSVVTTWGLLLMAALLVPAVILTVSTARFSHRVKLLRAQMHKARYQDDNMLDSFSGNDELTEAFEDLKVMVQDIKEKDAKMYQAELKARELRNSQQAMEYKMLASQINPHYLYNTLETIRMKALTTGSREVADCVKILGKTLHYVQENTGTNSTTLRRELDHVENYLAIQKLRFGERINYTCEVDPAVDARRYTMLPLLLQPVVENAVVHGLEAVDGIGFIRITAEAEGECLRIDVRDNGKGMTAQELETIRAMLPAPEPDPNASVALYNIHRRIQLSCGPEYGLSLTSEPGKGTCVTLRLSANSTKTQF